MRIAEQLVQAIDEGAYPVGARLPSEAELAAQFGASRPSVREALGALQFTGYVEPVKGSGTVVAGRTFRPEVPGPSGPRQVIDLLEARAVVEPAATALAAAGLNQEGHHRLARLVEGMASAVEEPGLHASTDLRLHLAIVGACPNPVLRDETERLLTQHHGPVWERIREQTWPSGEEPKQWLQHHQLLLAALEAGDAAAAADLSRKHLASVAENVASRIRLSPQQANRVRALVSGLREGGMWPHGG